MNELQDQYLESLSKLGIANMTPLSTTIDTYNDDITLSTITFESIYKFKDVEIGA